MNVARPGDDSPLLSSLHTERINGVLAVLTKIYYTFWDFIKFFKALFLFRHWPDFWNLEPNTENQEHTLNADQVKYQIVL